VVSSSRLRNVHEEYSCGYYDYIYYHIYLGNQSHHCPLVAMITRIRRVFNSASYCLSCRISKSLVSTRPSKRIIKFIHNRCSADVTNFILSLLRLTNDNFVRFRFCLLTTPRSDCPKAIIQFLQQNQPDAPMSQIYFILE